MVGKLICPIYVAGSYASQDFCNTSCTKERCAWWAGDRSAILMIADDIREAMRGGARPQEWGGA